MSLSNQFLFETNDYVKVIENKLIYNGKILEKRNINNKNNYLIHFLRWKTKYDRWIDEKLISNADDSNRMNILHEMASDYEPIKNKIIKTTSHSTSKAGDNVNSESYILIRVFTGINKSIQIDNFDWAVNSIRSRIESAISTRKLIIERISVSHLCELKWGIEDLIDWFLASDVHVILSHIHQGFVSINVNYLMEQVWRLKDHNGFPMGEELRCPVFLQNKMLYIEALGDMANNTLIINLMTNITLYDDTVLEEIKRYLFNNYFNYFNYIYFDLFLLKRKLYI